MNTLQKPNDSEFKICPQLKPINVWDDGGNYVDVGITFLQTVRRYIPETKLPPLSGKYKGCNTAVLGSKLVMIGLHEAPVMTGISYFVKKVWPRGFDFRFARDMEGGNVAQTVTSFAERERIMIMKV
jgi:hypothetical protein